MGLVMPPRVLVPVRACTHGSDVYFVHVTIYFSSAPFKKVSPIAPQLF
jgi:hypothetical protein